MIAVTQLVLADLPVIEESAANLLAVGQKIAAKIKEGGNFVALDVASDDYLTAQVEEAAGTLGLLDKLKNPLVMEIIKLLLGKLLTGAMG